MIIIIRAPIDATEATVNDLIYAARIRVLGKLLSESELDANVSVMVSIRIKHLRDRSKVKTHNRIAVIGKIDVMV